MRMLSLDRPSFVLLASFAVQALAQTTSTAATDAARWYQPEDSFVGNAFLDGFDFFTGSDPTHGRVQYVNKATAQSANLTYTTNNTFIMRADYTTTLTPTGPGRNSVRIQSKKAYGTGVMIANVRAMPVGCGTWPALWSNAESMEWPDGGEIDIIEGVNDQGSSNSVLHTSWQCEMVANHGLQSGVPGNAKCTSTQGDNAGCIVQPQSNDLSFGPNFNAVGGGWYAVERTTTVINMWFWARNDTSVPDEVRHAGFASENATQINPCAWGTPYASFGNSQCDLSKFQPQNIIINLTLCGDWAGNAYPSTCPKTCIQHVDEDPADFEDAAWNIASLTVWSPAAASAPAPPTPTPTPCDNTTKVQTRSRHRAMAHKHRAASHEALREEAFAF